MNISIILKEEIRKLINERKIITFNNDTYPNFGWCVILAGGGGSGKGYALNHNIPIDGKVINVDDFKSLYIKMKQDLEIDGEKYNSLNPQHVAYVHKQVSDNKYKDKYINNLLNKDAHQEERLPNIILDMTGKNPKYTVLKIAEKAKNVGYKICLVWVVANRHEAILRNLMRSRRIPDNVLHKIHNSLAETMPPFLRDSNTPKVINDAWLLFNSTENIEQSDLSGDEAKNCAIKLKTSPNGFIIDNDTNERLLRYLGKQEEDYNNLKTYLSSDEIINKYGKPRYDKNGNFNGYNFDRTQFKGNKNFYK